MKLIKVLLSHVIYAKKLVVHTYLHTTKANRKVNLKLLYMLVRHTITMQY
jgi:hypothetical protein